MNLRRALVAASMVAPSACSPTPAADRGRASSPASTSTSTPETAGTVAASPSSTVPASTTTTTLLVTTTSPLVVTPTTIRMPLPEDVGDGGQRALASWYAEGLADPDALTFAHLSMPFGTRVLFRGPLGSVVATCTDRGPQAGTGRTFDLSRGTFAAIAQLGAGVVTVTWSVVG